MATDTSEINKPKLQGKQIVTRTEKNSPRQIRATHVFLPDQEGLSSAIRWPRVAVIAVTILFLLGVVGSILRLQTKNGVIEIQGVPEGAIVEIDGTRLAITIQDGEPIVISQKPGSHELRMVRTGFEVYSEQLDLKQANPVSVLAGRRRFSAGIFSPSSSPVEPLFDFPH